MTLECVDLSGLFLMTEEVKFGSKLLRRRGRGEINTALAHIWPHHLSLTTPLHSTPFSPGLASSDVQFVHSAHLIFYVTQIWAGIIVVIIAASQRTRAWAPRHLQSMKKQRHFFYTIELY